MFLASCWQIVSKSLPFSEVTTFTVWCCTTYCVCINSVVLLIAGNRLVLSYNFKNNPSRFSCFTNYCICPAFWCKEHKSYKEFPYWPRVCSVKEEFGLPNILIKCYTTKYLFRIAIHLCSVIDQFEKRSDPVGIS